MIAAQRISELSIRYPFLSVVNPPVEAVATVPPNGGQSFACTTGAIMCGGNRKYYGTPSAGLTHRKASTLEYRNLGNSGLQVSVVGLGCNNFGGRLDAVNTK